MGANPEFPSMLRVKITVSEWRSESGCYSPTGRHASELIDLTESFSEASEIVKRIKQVVEGK